MKRARCIYWLLFVFFICCILIPSKSIFALSETWPRFGTKEDYDTYCNEADLPEDFISYDQISTLGAFHCYHAYSEDRVWYEIVDETGTRCTLEIYKSSDDLRRAVFTNYKRYRLFKWDFLNNIFGLPSPNDMLTLRRDIKESQYGCKIRCSNEIWYTYRSGDLSNVCWQYNGKLFVFIVEPGNLGDQMPNLFTPYPDLTADTFTVKLLNVETAEQAIEELMRACFPDQEYTGLQRIKVPKFKN